MQKQSRATQKKYINRLSLFALLSVCLLFCSCQSIKVTGSYSSSDLNVSNGQNTLTIQYTTKYKKTCIKLSSQVVNEMDSILKSKPSTVMNSVEIYFW
jgi:hypothetical protein